MKPSPAARFGGQPLGGRLKELQVKPRGCGSSTSTMATLLLLQYPEEAITHYHAYDEGFSGRMKIV